MMRSPTHALRAAAPLRPMTPRARAPFDDVGREALAVVDVVDLDVLVRQEAGGLDEVGIDLQRALVVQVAFGDGGAVQLAPQHA